MNPWSGWREVTQRAPPPASVAGDPSCPSPDATDAGHSLCDGVGELVFPAQPAGSLAVLDPFSFCQSNSHSICQRGGAHFQRGISEG